MAYFGVGEVVGHPDEGGALPRLAGESHLPQMLTIVLGQGSHRSRRSSVLVTGGFHHHTVMGAASDAAAGAFVASDVDIEKKKTFLLSYAIHSERFGLQRAQFGLLSPENFAEADAAHLRVPRAGRGRAAFCRRSTVA